MEYQEYNNFVGVREREKYMEKRRVFVERYAEEHRRKKDSEQHRDHESRPPRPARPPKPPRPPREAASKMTTKLITSKEELVSYVNDLGEQGHYIDIFKIEDGLYKVVVKERKRRQDGPRFIDVNVEE
jgi:hypothetical protein